MQVKRNTNFLALFLVAIVINVIALRLNWFWVGALASIAMLIIYMSMAGKNETTVNYLAKRVKKKARR